MKTLLPFFTGSDVFDEADHLPTISRLIQARSFDPETGIYECANGTALLMEVLPLVGIDADDIEALRTFMLELDLEDGATLQVLNWASPGIGPVVQNWSEQRMADEIGLTASRAQMFTRLALEGNARWRPQHYRVFIALILPPSRSGKGRDVLKQTETRLVSVLRQMGTQCRTVKPAMLLELYHEILFFENTTQPKTANWSEYEPLCEQVRAPGRSFTVNWNQIEWDNGMRARTFVHRTFPEEWAPGAGSALIGDLFNPHLQCGFPVLQAVTITTAAMSRDIAGMKAARIEQKSRSVMRFFMPHLKAESEDWQAVAKDLNDGAVLARVLIQSVVFAPADELEQAEADLRNIYTRQGFSFEPENGLHLCVLAMVLPLGADMLAVKLMSRLARWRTVLMRNALTFLPLFGEWRGNAYNQPGLNLFGGRRGQLASWTPFSSAGNYNCVIVGQSGAGKSALMQDIMYGLLATGGHVVVIDDGYSFRNSCALSGGAHINFGEAKLQINPFAAVDEGIMTAEADFEQAAISMLVAFCASLAHPGSEADDLERALLVEAVQQVWTDKGRKGQITDVVAALKKRKEETAAELVVLLSPFARDGAYGQMFSADCTISLENRLTVFEMSHVREREEIQAASMVLLIFMATQKMYHSRREEPVAIMIDEAWATLGGASADFIAGVARRARKYNGSLICASQSVSDFFLNRSAEAAWENSDWTLLMRQKDSSIEALRQERRIRLDGALERSLRSLQVERNLYSELVLLGPSGWDICRLILDPVSLAAYSSTAEEVANIEKMVADGMNRAEAIMIHARQQTTTHLHQKDAS